MGAAEAQCQLTQSQHRACHHPRAAPALVTFVSTKAVQGETVTNGIL